MFAQILSVIVLSVLSEEINWEHVQVQPETNYGEITTELPADYVESYKTMNHPDYNIASRPEIKDQALEFTLENYKKACNVGNEFEKLIYIGSNTRAWELYFFIHVALTDDVNLELEVSFKEYSPSDKEFLKKEIMFCNVKKRNTDL